MRASAVLLTGQRMMPRSRLAHIWLIGRVADDRIGSTAALRFPPRSPTDSRARSPWPASSAPLAWR